MDAALKELTKLEHLTRGSSKGKSPAIGDSLDALLGSLAGAKAALASGTSATDALAPLPKVVDARKKDIEDRQKEVYASLARFGKALDKIFTNPLPAYDPLFSAPEAASALERTVATHYLRTGQFDIAEILIEEAGIDISQEERAQYVDLYRILSALREDNPGPALEWMQENQDFLRSRGSPLEFHLHRDQYLRLLLPDSASPTSASSALAYARAHFSTLQPVHAPDIRRLMACLAYLPRERMKTSPYADLLSVVSSDDLPRLFAEEWCARAGKSRQPPLRTVLDIGAGDALARIEKGRRVMRERRSEWSRTDELPMEIPLPAENRYHSIFVCPVSKEQATEENPPVMMLCGHVITRESLMKLSKPGGKVKCPYCPVESQVNGVLRMYF